MMGNFLSLQSGKEIIPVDVIAIAPTKTPTRLPPTTGSTATRNSSSLKPKNPSNLPQNRQSTSTSNPSSTRTDSPQASTPKLSPSPNVRRSPAAKPSPNQQPGDPNPQHNLLHHRAAIISLAQVLHHRAAIISLAQEHLLPIPLPLQRHRVSNPRRIRQGELLLARPNKGALAQFKPKAHFSKLMTLTPVTNSQLGSTVAPNYLPPS
jgi:hypothetical protein